MDTNSRLAKWSSSLAQEPRSRGCLNLQSGGSGQELRLIGQAVSLPSQPHGACQEVLPQEAGMAVATGRERCGVNWAGQGVG